MHLTRPHIHFVVMIVASALTASAVSAQVASNQSSEDEEQLIAVLRSEAPAAEKAITCKLLAIHGSSKAVPELAKLLPNPRLSSWARIALEAIPGNDSDAALRSAIDTLDGELLVGVINSIGVRRDALAVDRLSAFLPDQDAQVASAAAVALGRIGNDAATRSLRSQLAAANEVVRSAIAEGCVLCAERLHAAGKADEAAELYDQVRLADVPLQRKIEATRGAILARDQRGIPLLLEQFRSPNKRMFQLALSTAREFPGGEVDKALATELAATTSSERAALMIQAMADRPETVVLTAVIDAAEQGPTQVRMSAVDALGRIGDASCVDTLLEIAIDDDAELAEACRKALAGLIGEQVDERIVALLRQDPGESYAVLIDLVGQRRIDAVPDLLEALDHADQEIRSAALTALGETVAFDQLSVLISAVVDPQDPDDMAVAQRALRVACVRMPNREACADLLSTTLDRLPAATKVMLLEILSDVGGSKALQALAKAAKSDEVQLQDTASRLLGRWNGVDAAPVLLDLAKTAPEARFQIRALRGYLGLARRFDMPETERAEMCRTALDVATRPAERELALDVIQLHPSKAALSLAVDFIKDRELKDKAMQATVVIAQKLGSTDEVTELLAQAGFERVELEIIKAEYGAGSTQKDVTELLQKLAGDLPFIALPSASYNASFGGDPLPGTPKHLVIRYRLNGTPGDASFAENELIILPSPK